MITLDEFEARLALLVGRPAKLRPFVCEGSPLACKAFIVGFNPATEISLDFWSFWRTGYGFDKAAWFAAYLDERRRRPLKPGKTRRPAVSNTRRVLDWIVESACPVSCLETNIYSAATEQAADLLPERRRTAPFDFLVESIRPQVVIAHGNDAIAHLRAKDLPVQVIEVPHFSRGWSQASARALGKRVNDLLTTG